MADQPVFAIDRSVLTTRRSLVAMIKFHVATGCTVQIEDTHHIGEDQLRYQIRLLGDAMQHFDATGRPIGVFSDIAALVEHAEAVTTET